MNKLIIKKGEIYIIRPHKKPFLAVIDVDTPHFPLLTEQHDRLEELKNEGFDLFFIFNGRENKTVKNINASKFTSLYEGIGFIITEEGKGTAHEFIDVSKYVSETLENIVGVTYAPIHSLPALTPEEIKELGKKFIAISTTPVFSPILRISRRGKEELATDYVEDWQFDSEDEISMNTIDYFTGAILRKKENNLDREYLGSGAWNTHKSPTIFPYFSIHWLKEFAGKEKEDESWWRSWDGEKDPMSMIASGIKYFNLPVLDYGPLEFELNPSLETEKKTRGRKKNG